MGGAVSDNGDSAGQLNDGGADCRRARGHARDAGRQGGRDASRPEAAYKWAKAARSGWDSHYRTE